ncbi:MAG: UvrD-helicase domain-containing protein [Proteobacteria bacterium]|nr:UvrD-helicase domain-containing protein [Pseudomonadota bacterium]
MLDLDSLNPEQRRGVETIVGPSLILAGAGTGKTRVITFRIAHMLDRGIAPEAIAAMTFTNKAAREMADRVRELVGKERASKIRIGTFHSFCLLILREFGTRLGLPKKFSLAGTSDQLDMLGRAIKEESSLTGVNLEALHAAISRAKNALLTPNEFAQRSMHLMLNLDGDSCAKAYELYERQLKLNRMIDFDDCIFKCVTLLENFPEVRAQLENRYRYYMVDEFQDTNEGQLRLLELVASKHNNVCVVGDDDQSIYSWRGAMFETLERFETMFKGAVLIKLEQNYRCTNTILKAANQVIKNNSKRKDKSLWSESVHEFPLYLEPNANEEDEAKWIALKCMSLIGEGGQAKEIAVLYRANNQARLIELALRELGIPYETFGGSSFFERKEVKDFLAYIRLIVRPDDRLAFWRIINTPHRGIGIKSLEKIEAACQASGHSPFLQAKKLSAELGLTSKSLNALNEFIGELSTIQALEIDTPEQVQQLGDEVIRRFGLVSDIREHTKDAASRDRKIENLKSLPGWLSRCASDMINEQGKLDVHDLLDRLTLNDRDISEKDDKFKSNRVSLMTIHASKGLEFPFVFLCGLEEELFPHKNSIGSIQGITEERRLFYVALTRAKLKLFLTYALERGTGAYKTSRLPSRFIKEIPPEIINGEVSERNFAPSKEEKVAKTISSFANLRAGLSGVVPRK